MLETGTVSAVISISLPFSPVFTMSIFSVVVIVVLLIVTPRGDVVVIVVLVVVVVASTVLPEIGKI
jgi:uncharacterized membrane protein